MRIRTSFDTTRRSRAALLAVVASVLLIGPASATANGTGAPPSGVTAVTQMLHGQNDLAYAIGAYSNVGGPTGMFDAMAADDFVVPTGQTWTLTDIRVTGSTLADSPGNSQGCGTATSVSVSLFDDDVGKPGTLLHTTTVTPADGLVQSACSFVIPNAVPPLGAGHYWLAVQAADPGGWFWRMRSTVAEKSAVWQNPDGNWGQGCTSWIPLSGCYPMYSASDLMFALRGSKTAGGNAVLYDQTDAWAFTATPSSLVHMNGTAEAADDFVVPAATKWHLTSVFVTGYDHVLTSPVIVRLYEDAPNAPGTLAYSLTVPVGSFADGPPPIQGWTSYTGGTLMIPIDAELTAGHYWLSVQATGTDAWSWGIRSVVSTAPAMWRGDQPGCADWGTLQTCFPNLFTSDKDLMFTLFGTNPHVRSVASTAANGRYTTGATIPITVTFDQPVDVTGTPQLALATGQPARADYQSGSGTDTLTFAYTVKAYDWSAGLDYASTDALLLNGGTITNAAGDDAQRGLPAPGSAGSLGANSDIAIDARPPSITLGAPEDGGFYFQGDAVTADYSCADEPGGSGLASCVGSVADGAPIDMTVGTHEFGITATDNLGNTFTMRYQYTVAKPVVLWNQADAASPAGGVATSFLPTGVTLAADDFVVPVGDSWTLHEIDVTGHETAGTTCGAVGGVIYILFTDPTNMFATIVGGGQAGPSDGLVQNGCSFTIPVDVDTLPAGRYWLSVLTDREWSWQARAGVYGEQALTGTGMPPAMTMTWQTVSEKLGVPGLDLMFTLRGAGALTPRDVIADVRDSLAMLTPPDKATGDKLAQAIKQLDASLASSLWLDPTHPSVANGNKVFDRERDAVRALMAIRNPDSAVLDAIARLVEETRSLATTAIDEAAGGNADRLRKAGQELAAGDKERTAGRYDRAIERYRNAWGQAIRA